MNEFARMVLSELGQSLGKALWVCAFAAIGIALYYFHHKKKYQGQRKFPWLRIMLLMALVGYLVIVDYATVARLAGVFGGGVNFHLFRAWREAWNNYSVKNWLNVLLNVALFMPLGVLLPILWKKMRKWYWMLCAGFGTSLYFELTQYLTDRGILDIDDLFANTLGAMMGFFFVMILISAFGEKGKRLWRSLGYSLLALIPIAAIGSIFLVYELQEYGNLPDSASYRANTKGVEWTLDCQLPQVGATAPTYQAQSMTMAQCDSFGAEFEELVQADFHEILYYDKETYFIDRGLGGNGAHFLMVSYLDGSYEYSHILTGYDDPEVVWSQTDRETLEALLRIYPLYIPPETEFYYTGNGWHIFSAQQIVDGSVLFDGDLRCRYGNDTVWKVENHLVAYTYYAEEAILSPEEAYGNLCEGHFSNGDFFEGRSPEKVRVTDCTFTYRIDTKGFYQPVYLFSLEEPDGDYSAQVFLSAIQ